MPPKLFDMIKEGALESEIQFIFDALIHAEEQGVHFINVYQNGETTFLFTEDVQKADQQLHMFRERTSKTAIGFANTGETWEERKQALNR